MFCVKVVNQCKAPAHLRDDCRGLLCRPSSTTVVNGCLRPGGLRAWLAKALVSSVGTRHTHYRNFTPFEISQQSGRTPPADALRGLRGKVGDRRARSAVGRKPTRVSKPHRPPPSPRAHKHTQTNLQKVAARVAEDGQAGAVGGDEGAHPRRPGPHHRVRVGRVAPGARYRHGKLGNTS